MLVSLKVRGRVRCADRGISLWVSSSGSKDAESKVTAEAKHKRTPHRLGKLQDEVKRAAAARTRPATPEELMRTGIRRSHLRPEGSWESGGL